MRGKPLQQGLGSERFVNGCSENTQTRRCRHHAGL